jgi:hypothetical protein
MSRVEPQPYFGGRACPPPILPADAYPVARQTAVATVAREDPNG